MLACVGFLAMAVRLYNVSLSSMGENLLVAFTLFGMVIGGAALAGWLLAVIRRYFNERR